MGLKDSTLTRVKPLFDFIGSDEERINQLLNLFSNNSLTVTKNSIVKIYYAENEKKIPPSNSLLIWLLKNLTILNKVENYGSQKIDSETFKKRELLFSGNKEVYEEAINLIHRKSQHSKGGWYIFEGNTRPDIFIETIDSIFIGEAKRTEKNITTKTKWLNQRDQLIRHIDSLLDQQKTIYSFYILDKNEYLKEPFKESMKLYRERDYFKENLKHRDEQLIERAMKSFIGFIFWDDISDSLNLRFPDTVVNF